MGGGGGASREARLAREAEEKREARVRLGTGLIRKKFGETYDDEYYKNLEKTQAAQGQLELQPQFEQARRSLMAALTRSGMRHSSVQERKGADLTRQRGIADQMVASRALDTVQRRKQDVANAENIAISQLQGSADPAAAVATASTLAAANSAPPVWQPLGQVFTDVTAGLATQADLERRGMNRYNVGVSNWFPSNRSRYTTNVSG
jgi:hypothetical protein